MRELAPLYELLSRLLTHEVDGALLGALQEPGAAALFERLAPGFSGASVDLEALAEEFAELFLIPGGTPPFASAWAPEGSPDELPERIATFIHRAMGALAVEQSGRAGRLSLDHAGLLCSLVARGLAGDDAEVELARHVRDEALAPWAPAFGAALEARATSPIYRATGALLVSLHAEGAGESTAGDAG